LAANVASEMTETVSGDGAQLNSAHSLTKHDMSQSVHCLRQISTTSMSSRRPPKLPTLLN